MIRLENINKYFNYHKKNEIHVINNTSLEFKETGLVALLGPSGSGKTTLLNVIGGLDKINSGNIYINDKKLPKGNNGKKDRIRVLNIGYIFQDYNLLENLSVYENIEIALKMVGIKNQKEIKQRIDYVLNATEMYRYRKKQAGYLSGGEKQRVGIARAIAKNPNIIIADEPTGNLDSKNTIEIMNIIKSISKDKLVILVTHETSLAEFYADRIIRLEDGKIISDEENIHSNVLDYRIDNKIYLKDLTSHKKIKTNEYDLDFYTDNKNNVNLDIVCKGNNLYIRSNNIDRVEIVDEHSAVEFIDDHYKKISKDDYEKTGFNQEKLKNNHNLKYSSIYNIFTMLKSGYNRFRNYSGLKKTLLVGFFASAMFIVYAISSFFASVTLEDKNFITENKNYVFINNDSSADYTKLTDNDSVTYVLPGSSVVTFYLNETSIYQFANVDVPLTGSISSIKIISENDLIYGKMTESDNEIVVDKMALDTDEFYNYQMVGINDVEDLIGKKFTLGENEYTVVGITDLQSPSIYANEYILLNIISDYTAVNKNSNFKAYTSDIEITKGSAPVNDYEVVVNTEYAEEYAIGKTIDIKIANTKLKVVGYYYSKTESNDIYVNNNTYLYSILDLTEGFTVYGGDAYNLVSYLENDGFSAEVIYEKNKNEYINEVKDETIGSLVIAGVLLGISFIEIFFMIRSSFMSKVKETGIYRSIGAKKSDIYKMFLGEIIVISTFIGLPGIILMSIILYEISKISAYSGSFIINIFTVTLSILLYYLINIIGGLLPVRKTVKHTPAEILSRTDID